MNNETLQAATYDSERAEALVREIEGLLRSKVQSIFVRYDFDFQELLVPLKWKPVVLIIGNYSSGKSTFINELLGREVQRTGQAPTDDSFTILTAPEAGGEHEIPGSTVARDERLPFSALEDFGESLLAHLRLKYVEAPILEKMAIIDTPGMLDSVTEKDRGYDYLGVVGELAKQADIIILMFDPLKAGTIKETYKAIRGTLPGSTYEDRILYVMNRIDECDNLTDLVRSYGTLCWNLSQMTGRKDIPRIFLTYSPEQGREFESSEIWAGERHDLMEAINNAPGRRISHILQDVGREIQSLILAVEALSTFKNRFLARLKSVLRYGLAAAFGVFFFGDAVLKLLTGKPEITFIEALLQGHVTGGNLIGPLVGISVVVLLMLFYAQRLSFPGIVKKSLEDLDDLVDLDTAYKKDLWCGVREHVRKQLTEQPRKHLLMSHQRHLRRLRNFLERDLSRFYQQNNVD